MKIDGDLSEFKGAFCTPMEYFNEKLRERAAQFLYMWDERSVLRGAADPRHETCQPGTG